MTRVLSIEAVRSSVSAPASQTFTVINQWQEIK